MSENLLYRADPPGEGRVGVVEDDHRGMGIDVGERFPVQTLQGRDEAAAVSFPCCEGVSFIFVLPRVIVGDDLEKRADRPQDHGGQNIGEVVVDAGEAEGAVEPRYSSSL